MKTLKRVLIIEDDLSIAEIERDYLDMSGFAADIEADGAAGLSRALAEDYDLVLLDLMLPGKDGFAVCRELREKKNIPILMVSAKKEDIDKIRGLGLGADDFIVKPFSPGELVARVRAHLARFDRLTLSSEPPPAKELTLGRLSIQPGARRVLVEGREIELKNKEYELLYFFVTHVDTVFSKETLYEEIWGMESMGDSATVTVHVGRLREKIEADPSAPQYIQTVWGVGYRFRAP